MPAPRGAPAWAGELSLAFESGASGQFVLYGNVHDRLAVGAALVNIERYIQDELLAGFAVVFAYDLGNGLTVEQGDERLQIVEIVGDEQTRERELRERRA